MTVASTNTPLWALAHGGPNSLYEPEHKAHKFWKGTLSKDIVRAEAKAIVVVSAHWEAEDDPFAALGSRNGGQPYVQINTNASNPLIFDFYGFPQSYYNAHFTTSNPAWLHTKVSAHLQQHGYRVGETDRGLDHGVWVPLKAAFGDRLDIPLVQVSLPVPRDAASDGAAALDLGRALRGLRSQGIIVLGSGQPVHNLRDLGRYGWDAKLPYAQSFAAALTTAMLAKTEQERTAGAKSLYARDDYLSAHPTPEHLLPLLVALGAAHDDEQGEKAFAYEQSSLIWDMFRFA